MDRNRILTLALENLEKQRADFEAAIEQIRMLRGEIGQVVTRKRETPILVSVKRRSKTRAERKAQSVRMKAYWAARRAQDAEAASRPSKRRPKTDEEKRVLSLKMKQAWARRKAEAAK